MTTTKKKKSPSTTDTPSNKKASKPPRTSTQLAIAGVQAQMKSMPRTTMSMHKDKAKKENMPKPPLRKKK